jgi:DNA (cytosine-5)-methyltransferase 1
MRSLRTLHLFAGAGGGLLADLILGHEPVCAVEWDAYCCAILRERAADGWFPGLHVHEGDVRLFDPSEWAGRVDCIHAGFPCQDISVAGRGAGLAGERSGLWSEVRRAVGVIRPAEVFLENSPAIVGRGLDTVLADLAQLGYDARWLVLAADAVGANHGRPRWWCRAFPADTGRDARRAERSSLGEAVDEDPGREGHRGDADAGRRGGHAGERHRSAAVAGRSATGRCELPAAWWSVEPRIRRVGDGLASRKHRIRALGNGQVPLCAATAWRLLGGE